jgi:hypothetical protein
VTPITYDDVTARLREQDIPFGDLALHDGLRMVTCERGGRLFGPFLPPEVIDGPDPGSLTWLHPAFRDPDDFEAFLAGGDWNIGGARIWVAPEIQYGVRDRADFWGSIQLPVAMDPGTWSMAQPSAGRWTFEQDLTLTAYNIASGEKALRLMREVVPAPDPLRALPEHAALMDGVAYGGYRHTVTIAEAARDAIMSEAWALVQLNPGGVVFIPASPHAQPTDYFEPVDGEHQTRHDHHVALRITGDRRYKVGYKAAHLFGRLGYYHALSPTAAYLLVRAFFVNPSMPYVEEPADCAGCRGHAVHVYNDGGMFGGFGELECNGRTIGGETGRSAATDTFMLWCYVGPPAKVRRIGEHLLGVRQAR